MRKLTTLLTLFLTLTCSEVEDAPLQGTVPAVFVQPPEEEVEAILWEKPQEYLLVAADTSVRLTPSKRYHNVATLAQGLHSMILEPGATFSFNEMVGPRTLDEGFLPAPSYENGEVSSSIGGGSCQVSSLLYAAALKLNLTILERHAHSRMSSYTEPGLDATVNYPEQCWGKKQDPRICLDLRFKNPYSFPLTFELRFQTGPMNSKEQLLILQAHGKGPVPIVSSVWRAYRTTPFAQRFRQVPWARQKRLKQSGRLGVLGARVSTLEHPDGQRETKRVLSTYLPVPEVWEVGPDWNE